MSYMYRTSTGPRELLWSTLVIILVSALTGAPQFLFFIAVVICCAIVDYRSGASRHKWRRNR